MTQITNTIGQPHSAYCLLALLSDDAKRQLSELFELLQEKLGKNVYIMPEETLHITLCEIIQSKDYSENKEMLYSRNSSNYQNQTEQILAQFSPIEVVFDEVVVSPQAIIIKGRDNGSFEEIRKELVKNLPLPSETKKPPTIIHCTIARFLTEIPIDEVREITKQYSIVLNERVSSFSLIHSNVTPLLAYDTLRRYELNFIR